MLLIGKPSINGPFSMAMLNNQRVSYILRCGISHLLAYTQSNGSSISHCSKPRRVNSGKIVLETIRDDGKLLTCSSFNLGSYSPIMLNPYLSAIELPQGASLSRAADKAALTPMVAERESAKRASRVGRAQDFADGLRDRPPRIFHF